MFINSVPVSSISSAVWNAATRTLSANPEPVPVADSVANVYASDVIGNKTDAPPSVGTAANGTLSIAAYIKSLWDLLRSVVSTLALQTTTSQTGNDAQSTAATVYQLVASSAAAIRAITFVGTVTSPSATETIEIYILTGPGGSETTRARAMLVVVLAIASEPFNIRVNVNLAVGTRVAWKYTTSTGTQTVSFSYTIEEA